MISLAQYEYFKADSNGKLLCPKLISLNNTHTCKFFEFRSHHSLHTNDLSLFHDSTNKQQKQTLKTTDYTVAECAINCCTKIK